MFCANRLGENMRTGRRIWAGLTCFQVADTERLCTLHGSFVAVFVIREIHLFVVVFFVAIEKFPHLCASLHSGLIPKVEQQPQFKCRVGDRQLDRIVARHLDRVRNSWMVIDIENRPNGIVLEIIIFLFYCFRFGCFLTITRNCNDSQRDASFRSYFDFDSRILTRICKALKVLRLCYLPLTNDQEAWLRRQKREASGWPPVPIAPFGHGRIPQLPK